MDHGNGTDRLASTETGRVVDGHRARNAEREKRGSHTVIATPLTSCNTWTSRSSDNGRASSSTTWRLRNTDRKVRPRGIRRMSGSG